MTVRIGITYDLRKEYLKAGYGELETAEFDREDTIDAIAGSLKTLGHQPVRIGNVRQLAKKLVGGQRWDLVFNICEGLNGFGREAQVPALLDAYGIPYTFSDALVSALTLHKALTKVIVRSHGIPTPDFALVESREDLARVKMPLPLFAKPVAEGTGKGVTAASKITSMRQLTQTCTELMNIHHQPVLVERFLPGREFTVGLLGTGTRATVLGTLEITLNGSADAEVYSYRNKEYCEELVTYSLLPPGVLKEQVEAVALAAWRCLGCRDGGRVDIRLDARGDAQFLEVNPLAGLHPEHSDLPIIGNLMGIPYNEVVGRILESALERTELAACRRASQAA